MQEPESGWSSRAGYKQRNMVPLPDKGSNQHRQQQSAGAGRPLHRPTHTHTAAPTQRFCGPSAPSILQVPSTLPRHKPKSLTQALKRRGLSTACTTQFQVPLLHSAQAALQPLQSFSCRQTGLGCFQTAFLVLLNHKHKTSSHTPTQILPLVDYYIIDSPMTKDQKTLNSMRRAENTSHPTCEHFS